MLVESAEVGVMEILTLEEAAATEVPISEVVEAMVDLK